MQEYGAGQLALEGSGRGKLRGRGSRGGGSGILRPRGRGRQGKRSKEQSAGQQDVGVSMIGGSELIGGQAQFSLNNSAQPLPLTGGTELGGRSSAGIFQIAIKEGLSNMEGEPAGEIKVTERSESGLSRGTELGGRPSADMFQIVRREGHSNMEGKSASEIRGTERSESGLSRAGQSGFYNLVGMYANIDSQFFPITVERKSDLKTRGSRKKSAGRGLREQHANMASDASPGSVQCRGGHRTKGSRKKGVSRALIQIQEEVAGEQDRPRVALMGEKAGMLLSGRSHDDRSSFSDHLTEIDGSVAPGDGDPLVQVGDVSGTRVRGAKAGTKRGKRLRNLLQERRTQAHDHVMSIRPEADKFYEVFPDKATTLTGGADLVEWSSSGVVCAARGRKGDLSEGSQDKNIEEHGLESRASGSNDLRSSSFAGLARVYDKREKWVNKGQAERAREQDLETLCICAEQAVNDETLMDLTEVADAGKRQGSGMAGEASVRDGRQGSISRELIVAVTGGMKDDVQRSHENRILAEARADGMKHDVQRSHDNGILAEAVEARMEDQDHFEISAAVAEAYACWSSEVAIIWDWESYCPYASFSAKLQHTFEDEGPPTSSGCALPLFGSSNAFNLRATACKDTRMADYYDLILNVGGSVWALDWCPRRHGWQVENGDLSEFLAVGAHPYSSSIHRLGEPVFGRGLIQVWAFSLPSFPDVQADSKTWKHDQRRKRGRGRGKLTTEHQAHQISKDIVIDNINRAGEGMKLKRSFAQENCMGARTAASALEEVALDGSLAQATHSTGPVIDLNCIEGLLGRNDSCRGGRSRKNGDNMEDNSEKMGRAASELAVSAKRVDFPQMVLGLAHDGGVTWDAKWQPTIVPREVDKKEVQRLGYLAVLFGDGSMQVFDVPLPSMVKHFKARENRKLSLNPVIVKINPVFRCSGLPGNGHKSMPLVLEWSSSPHDLLLAGCHDGVVALWKFSPRVSSEEDTRPLMTFVADSAPIRTIAWAPDGSSTESRNVFATAGHSGGLQLWDLRDPFHPLWDLHLSKGGCILSIDWPSDPRCIILSMDDGSIRTLSLDMAISDTPVTGKACSKNPTQVVHTYFCSSFAIWTVQVSRATGLALYGGEDGSVIQFQLTDKSINVGGERHRQPHYLCGQFDEDLEAGVLSIISQKVPIPVQMRKNRTDCSTPLSKMLFTANASSPVHQEAGGRSKGGKQDSRSLLASAKGTKRSKKKLTTKVSSAMDSNQVSAANMDSLALVPYNSERCQRSSPTTSEECFAMEGMHVAERGKQQKHGNSIVPESTSPAEPLQLDADSLALVPFDGDADMSQTEKIDDPQSARACMFERMPPKAVSVHRVRWNRNKGSERWICFGGAAGIVRCQQIYPQA